MMIVFLLYIKVFAKILFFCYIGKAIHFFTYLYNGISYCYEIEHLSP